MTRTIRRYNDPNKRAFWMILEEMRYMERDPGTGRWKEHVPDGKDFNQLKHAVLCMGNCPFCKDTKRDQMNRTKKEKEFRLALLDSDA